MKQNLLKTWLMLCLFCLCGVGSTWADNPVTLFHETFGDNSGSARNWSDTYSVKSGVSAVYSGITGYTVSNAKQGKNTTGSTASGLNQSTTGTDAYIIIGPLNVANCQSLALKYQWKAASVKGTYTTKAYYATSSTGSYTEITGGTGNGATTFVERSYSVPAAAQVSTLYLKIVWNTSNTQAIIDEVDLSGVQNNTPDPTPTVTAPTFDVVAGTYTENKTVKVSNYSSDYIYAYTTDGSDPAIDGELNVTNGTAYDNNEGITISSSCTLKMIAVDEDGNKSNITSASYVINKPYASLEALVAADLTTGTNVTVTFENVPIKSFYTSSQSKRTGVYFDIQKDGHDIEIYYSSSEVPTEWVEGGTLSGTMTNCPWTYYERGTTWELAPASGWAWTNLTYKAPAQKTITALAVSGTPTKTTYNVGDAFETAGLVVTATYSDETQEVISTGFDWVIDYGKTGEVDNAALVAGTNSVDVMVYTDEVMSEVYTVEGLTVNVPVNLTSIAVSGAPTKTEYYAGDAFETAGLVVTGHYSNGTEAPITEGIEWTIDPETLTLETTSVDVMASVGEVNSEVFTVNDLTVTENPVKTATKNGFTTGDNSDSHNFTDNTDISFEAFKGDAGTSPAIPNRTTYLRLYQNGGYVTIKGAAGVTISQVKITTGSTYESTTVGYCVDNEAAPTTGESVAKSSDYTITNLNNQSVSIYCLGTTSSTRLDIAAIEVKYTKEDIVLSSIALSGEYQTEFIQNQTFNHDGIVVTATFSNGQYEDVTAKATFSEPDMTTTGTKTITVSYTDADVTKTAEYEISVAEEVVTAIALSGEYQTTFRAGDEFNHDNLEVKATYNSGRTGIDVTNEATVSTPDMSVAGEQTITVSYGGQTANYTIKVLSANTIFYESFDTNNGTGGNDGNWNGSIAANNISSDNEGWTCAYSGGANKCAKFGTGSGKGAATTPALGYEGAAIMTFKSAAWNSNNETLKVNLSVEGDGAVSQSSITNEKGKWTEYTVTLTGLTAESKVKFEAENSSNNRFFLDEVMIVEAPVLVLDETDTGIDEINDTYGEVTVNRTLKAGVWNTFCVPFDMSSAEIKENFGTNASVKALDPDYLYVSGLNFGIRFIDATSIKAGVPYMVKIDGAEKTSFTVYGAKVNTTALNDVTVTNGGNSLTFQGNYTSMKADPASFIISNNTFYYVDSDVTVNGFRGYITTKSAEGGNVRALSFGFGEGITTGISTNLSAEQQNARIYNLQGMQQSKLSKGVNIVNGRKIIK